MAKIVINVAGEPAGEPGVAREFEYSKIDPTPPLVTLTIDDNSGITQWLWEIVDQPNEGSVELATPTANTATFTPDAATPGTYLIKCTFNGGASYAMNAVAWLTQYRELRIPAATETTEYSETRGWADALTNLIYEVDSIVDGSPSLELDTAPSANLTASSTSQWLRGQVDDASTAIGDIMCLGSDGHWDRAKADLEATTLGIALALESGSGSNKKLLVPGGFFRKDTWSWTRGKMLFVSPTTAGGLTETRPLPPSYGVTPVAIAITPTVIWMLPIMWYAPSID